MNISLYPTPEWVKKFAEQYENHAQADHFLNLLILRVERSKERIERYESSEKSDAATFKKRKRELAEVTDHLTFLGQSLESLQSQSHQLSYKQTFYEEKAKKAKLESWMETNNPTKNNLDQLDYELEKANFDYSTALAEAFCEWFATGAAGPGTLTFNGKTYTAS
jgi:predicted  nucleic acid-binding Zn-ribbon protein